jgi:hypothetical protein
MRIASTFVIAALALSLAHPAAQAPEVRTLTGTLSIRTKGATTGVLGKNPDKKQGDFMFCINQDRAAPQVVDFTGSGRVIYKPMPPLDAAAGVTVQGPEMVEPTLAVIAEDGQAWLFLGKGQKPLLPASDPALAKAKTVRVRDLQRSDWAPKFGPRRGTDLEGCLAPGG